MSEHDTTTCRCSLCDKIRKVAAALQKFGRHEFTCTATQSAFRQQCDCGLDAAIAEAQEES